MKGDACLNYAVEKICKVCERMILIVPCISLECNTKKSNCFNVLPACVLMFLKVPMYLGKRGGVIPML